MKFNFSISKSSKTMAQDNSTHTHRDEDGNRLPIPPLAHFVVACADRSGSMVTMEGAPAHQLHQQMTELQETAQSLKVPTMFSLVTFDNTIEVPIENLNLQTDSIPNLKTIQNWMQPRGMTRLYDSGLTALKLLETHKDAFVAKLPPHVKDLNPDIKMSYVLLTDGADNSSEYDSRDKHKAKLEEMREEGLMAIFLGANIDAVTTGGSMGFSAPTSIQMAPTFEGASQCLRAVSNTLQRVTTGSDNQTINCAPVTPPLMPPPLQLRRY